MWNNSGCILKGGIVSIKDEDINLEEGDDCGWILARIVELQIGVVDIGPIEAEFDILLIGGFENKRRHEGDNFEIGIIFPFICEFIVKDKVLFLNWSRSYNISNFKILPCTFDKMESQLLPISVAIKHNLKLCLCLSLISYQYLEPDHWRRFHLETRNTFIIKIIPTIVYGISPNSNP